MMMMMCQVSMVMMITMFSGEHGDDDVVLR